MLQSQGVSGLIVLFLWFLTGSLTAVFLNFLGEQSTGQEVGLVVEPSPWLGKEPLKIHPLGLGNRSSPAWSGGHGRRRVKVYVSVPGGREFAKRGLLREGCWGRPCCPSSWSMTAWVSCLRVRRGGALLHDSLLFSRYSAL